MFPVALMGASEPGLAHASKSGPAEPRLTPGTSQPVHPDCPRLQATLTWDFSARPAQQAIGHTAGLEGAAPSNIITLATRRHGDIPDVCALLRALPVPRLGGNFHEVRVDAGAVQQAHVPGPRAG